MSGFYVREGDRVQFSKTVGESDVYLFAGITGDMAPNHVDEEYMKSTPFGYRIAHGALLVGFMSTTSTMMISECVREDAPETPVSLGYDRIRFLAPVYIGDTITVTYAIRAVDCDRRRSTGDVVVTNQDGDTVAVAEHILKWVPRSGVPGTA